MNAPGAGIACILPLHVDVAISATDALDKTPLLSVSYVVLRLSTRHDMLNTTFRYFAHVVIAFHAFQRPERDIC